MIVGAPEREGRYVVLPCYLADSGIFHIKTFSIYLNNPKSNLPPNYYYYFLHDTTTGELKAIMGGNYLTNLRTAAVPGLATKYMARKESRILALFGAGPVAEQQILAQIEVAEIDKIYLFVRNRDHADSFIAHMQSKYHVDMITVANSPQEAVREADIIVTATSSTKPVFDGNDVKPGAHINAVGGINPKGSELDEHTIKNSRIVLEATELVLGEAGELIIPLEKGVITQEDIYGEIAEIIAGKKIGRSTPEEITLFKTVGLAMEDAVVANLAYEKALEKGLGQSIEI
jgi:ornithine cyclodeaminase/alanine dehydrogenase